MTRARADAGAMGQGAVTTDYSSKWAWSTSLPDESWYAESQKISLPLV